MLYRSGVRVLPVYSRDAQREVDINFAGFVSCVRSILVRRMSVIVLAT